MCIRDRIYTDQLAFWPDTSATNIQLRMGVTDLAGNFATASRQTVVQAPAWRASSHSTARPTDRPAVDPGRVESPAGSQLKQPAEDQSAWKNAFYSKLRNQENQQRRQESNSSARSQRPPVRAMQVGSTPEFTPPPTPEGWVINSGDNGASGRTVVPRPLQSVSKPPVHQFPSNQTPPRRLPRELSASPEETS